MAARGLELCLPDTTRPRGATRELVQAPATAVESPPHQLSGPLGGTQTVNGEPVEVEGKMSIDTTRTEGS